jgi:protease-4
MDHEQNDTPEQPEFVPEIPIPADIPKSAGIPQSPVYNKPAKKRNGWKIFFGLLFSISLVANIFLFIIIMAMAVILPSSGKEDVFNERTVVDGKASNKIAIIRIEGIIENQLSERVRTQLENATKDKKVKAIIIRIISPGGTVSASDQIHHEITKFRQSTGKPVVAFMQSIAASGGYYSAVACNEIIAEPTVITGSIGVIMNNFVIKELLEEKLGIIPVTIKSGPRKDWPSMFSETTDEQKEYLQQKLIRPAYDRFVKLVAMGRFEKLTTDEVIELADGSIYSAQEAKDKKLIDDIGYLEDAVAAAERLAGISSSRVFEYKEHFSFSSMLGGQANSLLPINSDTLSKLATPQLLYMWDASWQ